MGLILLFQCNAALCQSGELKVETESHQRMPELISFFAPFIFPKVIQDIYSLKEFVRGEEYAAIRMNVGDIKAVDQLYLYASRLSWNNIYQSLLISLVATIDHHKFGINLPLIGSLFWVPLTSEVKDEFSARVAGLPSCLFTDSPQAEHGDKDKLQHFFGSAFLTYFFESREAADRVGWFVEWGEESFIVDGALDTRDTRANHRGQDFGMRLLTNRDARPSEFLGGSLLDSKETDADSVLIQKNN